MTVQLECFVKSVLLLEYLNEVLYINVWASIIQTFYYLSPKSSDEQGSAVPSKYFLLNNFQTINI